MNEGKYQDAIEEELAAFDREQHLFEITHPAAGVYRGVLVEASLVEYPGIAGMRFELICSECDGDTYEVRSLFGSEPGGSLWRVLAHWKRYTPEQILDLEADRDPELLQRFLGQQADVLVHTYDAWRVESTSFVADLAPPNRYRRQRRSGRWYLTRREWMAEPRLDQLVFRDWQLA